MVLIGLPQSRRVLDANEQLARRFSAQAVLEPFSSAHLMRLLEQIDRHLPFAERSGLPELTDSFLAVSKGLIAPVMKVIRAATGWAIDQNLPCLDRALLARAFTERIAQEEPPTNPFADNWNGNAELVPSVIKAAAPASSASRSKAKPSISQILVAR